MGQGGEMGEGGMAGRDRDVAGRVGKDVTGWGQEGRGSGLALEGRVGAGRGGAERAK